MPNFNDPVEAPIISRRVFEKVQLNVAQRLSKAQLHGLAADMRAQVIEDHTTQSVLAHFHTFLLGGNFTTVHLEEEVKLYSPHTWWDHVKADVCSWLCTHGYDRLKDKLWARIQWREQSKKVTKTEKVATHLCPHVAVATKPGHDLVHFSWLDGNMEEAQGLMERLKCNGRLS